MSARNSALYLAIEKELMIGMHERAVANEENRANPSNLPKTAPTLGDIAENIEKVVLDLQASGKISP